MNVPKRLKKKKVVLYVLGIVAGLICLILFFTIKFVEELEMTSKAYTKEAVLAITKNWNSNELLSRGSKEFKEKTNVDVLSKEFSKYRDALGPLKAYLDSQGNTIINLNFKGITIKAEQKAQALYEKGSAKIDLTLSYTDNTWKIDKFSLTPVAVSFAKADQESKDKKEERKEQKVSLQEKPAPQKKEEKEFEIENFSYTSKGRRDPFFAEILDQRKRIAKEKYEKIGYELEELKVVGYMERGDDKFIMMEDKQGNGILFKKGDYINKNLWIVDITGEKIVYGYRLKDEIRTISMDLPGKK